MYRRTTRKQGRRAPKSEDEALFELAAPMLSHDLDHRAGQGQIAASVSCLRELEAESVRGFFQAALDADDSGVQVQPSPG